MGVLRGAAALGGGASPGIETQDALGTALGTPQTASIAAADSARADWSGLNH